VGSGEYKNINTVMNTLNINVIIKTLRSMYRLISQHTYGDSILSN